LKRTKGGWGFWESEEDDTPGARARLLIVPPGEDPVAAESSAMQLRRRPVSFEALLTLPDGYDDAADLGLDRYEKHAYDSVLSVLWDATGEPSYRGGQHWIGGHITGT
jgi:hypothetical protein